MDEIYIFVTFEPVSLIGEICWIRLTFDDENLFLNKIYILTIALEPVYLFGKFIRWEVNEMAKEHLQFFGI